MGKTTTDIFIHEQRLGQEMIFQYMIKQNFLQDKSVKDLKELANNVHRIIGNFRYNLKKNGIKEFIDDNKANDVEWVSEILEKTYTLGSEQE
jgi:hypothetical protein